MYNFFTKYTLFIQKNTQDTPPPHKKNGDSPTGEAVAERSFMKKGNSIHRLETWPNQIHIPGNLRRFGMQKYAFPPNRRLRVFNKNHTPPTPASISICKQNPWKHPDLLIGPARINEILRLPPPDGHTAAKPFGVFFKKNLQYQEKCVLLHVQCNINQHSYKSKNYLK